MMSLNRQLRAKSACRENSDSSRLQFQTSLDILQQSAFLSSWLKSEKTYCITGWHSRTDSKESIHRSSIPINPKQPYQRPPRSLPDTQYIQSQKSRLSVLPDQTERSFDHYIEASLGIAPSQNCFGGDQDWFTFSSFSYRRTGRRDSIEIMNSCLPLTTETTIRNCCPRYDSRCSLALSSPRVRLHTFGIGLAGFVAGWSCVVLGLVRGIWLDFLVFLIERLIEKWSPFFHILVIHWTISVHEMFARHKSFIWSWTI